MIDVNLDNPEQSDPDKLETIKVFGRRFATIDNAAKKYLNQNTKIKPEDYPIEYVEQIKKLNGLDKQKDKNTLSLEICLLLMEHVHALRNILTGFIDSLDTITDSDEEVLFLDLSMHRHGWNIVDLAGICSFSDKGKEFYNLTIDTGEVYTAANGFRLRITNRNNEIYFYEMWALVPVVNIKDEIFTHLTMEVAEAKNSIASKDFNNFILRTDFTGKSNTEQVKKELELTALSYQL